MTSYSNLIERPFTATPSHIPDADSQKCGLVVSRLTTTFSPSNISGATSTHTGGIIMQPYPSNSFITFKDVDGTATIVSDLNVAGTSMISASSVPNMSSFAASNCRVRCVAMGVRITYQGTELNRAGRIYAGTAPIVFPASSVSTTGTVLSPLSTTAGGVPSSVLNLKRILTNLYTQRVSDGVVEFHWIPNGTPNYSGLDAGGGSNLTTATTSGAKVTDSLYSTTGSGNGCPLGTNQLVVMIEGDVTSTANATGNPYAVECIWHWEIVPQDVYGIAYQLDKTVVDLVSMARALNSLGNSVATGKQAKVSAPPMPKAKQPKKKKSPSADNKATAAALAGLLGLPAAMATGATMALKGPRAARAVKNALKKQN